MSREITIYTTENCSYCKAAKDLLRKRDVTFREVPITKGNTDQWRDVVKGSGMTTTPQIFFGEALIGGFRELAQQDEKDQLRSLKGAPKGHGSSCACCS